MEGQLVSHYRILERLGGGGMGVVYKAEDIKLKRLVALKFLPPELTRDDAAKQRFVQEARAASALDHANVCTVYDIDETPDGQVFLVMAYYAGETLKKKVERGPLELDDALDIAIQVAQGLARAHESRIIHRDVKPANVMVTGRGEAKLVDFGLAKLAGEPRLTATGATVGTPAYMSPEQAHGGAVDPRTDIWSLGIVLYEMGTGQLPFKGENPTAICNAILERNPTPMTALRTGVPMDLERIVSRAMSKRREDRYQTMIDFISELRRVRRELDTESHAITVERRPVTRRLRAWLVAGVVLAALAGFYLLRLRERNENSVPRFANPIQLTTAQGVEDYPTWSPDGLTLAYQSNQTGNWDIWIAQSGGGPAVNRTADLEQDMFPSWSPDGRQIAFFSSRDGGGYFVMPTLGGPPRRVIAEVWPPPHQASPPRWSEDASKLACIGYEPNDVFLQIVTLRTGESRRLSLPGGSEPGRYDLSWSSDERFVAYVAGADQPQVTRLSVLRLADGQAFTVTEGLTLEWSPSWSPEGGLLYFLSNRGGSMDLWMGRVKSDGAPVGPPQPVTTGIGMRRAVFSADGKKLAYSRGRLVANLWRVPILADRPATWADAQQLTFDEAFLEFVDISPDGERLAVSSDRRGNPDLWVLPAGGGDMQQLTDDPTPDWLPAWSPLGNEIAFYAYRSGNRDIWVMPARGGAARQVTKENSMVFLGSWSPDGRELAFSSNRGGDFDIWVIPVVGGEARPITSDPEQDGWPSWSPDGKSLVFSSIRGETRNLRWAPATGGRAEPLTRGPGSFATWSADGKTIYFTRPPNLWSISADSRTERPVTDFAGKRGDLAELTLATDGRYLYFGWAEDVGDIWVMDVVDEGDNR